MTPLDMGFYRPPTAARTTRAGLQAQLLQLAADWGFQGAVYAQIGHAIPSAARQGLAPLRLVASAPNARAWYLNEEGEILDPNAAVAREGGLPYAWTTSDTARLSPMQAAFYARLRRRAVVSGVCAPVADYVAGPAYVSFYNAYEPGPEEGPGHGQMAGLSFAAQAFHARAKATLPAEARAGGKDSLTPREIACLRLGALGHTVAETADALNVTPRTIEFHLKNAADKFGAPNKLRAILIAVREGLIEA
jgi:LuxR family transcriptional activator of conjugal transfer of Ti plasmids